MAQPFIAHEEIRRPFVQRSTQVSSELITLERRLRNRSSSRAAKSGVKSVARVKPVVTQIIVDLAMELVGTGAGCNIYYGTRIPTESRTVSGIINLELRNRVDRRLER